MGSKASDPYTGSLLQSGTQAGFNFSVTLTSRHYWRSSCRSASLQSASWEGHACLLGSWTQQSCSTHICPSGPTLSCMHMHEHGWDCLRGYLSGSMRSWALDCFLIKHQATVFAVLSPSQHPANHTFWHHPCYTAQISHDFICTM